MLQRIHHVARAVIDLEAAQRTYHPMGYKTFRTFRSRSTHADIALLTHPREVGIELFQFADLQGPGVDAMRHHIAIESDDLDRDLEQQLAEGATLVREISEGVPVARFCFVEDAAGNLVELAVPWPEETKRRAA